MARDAQVRELWLTHYSPAMLNPEEFLPVTQQIFANTRCGDNLLTTTLRFQDELGR
jgi:ribonuclease Z